MYALNLRKRTAPNRRDGGIDWNAAIEKAKSGVQSGDAVDQQYTQLNTTVTAFLEQTKTQAEQLLQQLAAVRASAQAQAELFDEIENLYSEDDAPPEFVDLYENMTSGDWESELDDLENALTDITR